MATTNPYALTDYESFWDDGYAQGLDSAGVLFAKPPDVIAADAQDKWKEGWKAARSDLKAGVNTSSEPPAESSSDASGPSASSAAADGHRWTFEINGRKVEGATTEEAQKALRRVVDAIARSVDFYRDYQKSFNETAGSSVMNFIIETAAGGYYQPDEALYAKVDSEIEGIRGQISNGDIAEAVAAIGPVSADAEKAGQAWVDFLGHWDKGGTNTIKGLGGVVKVSIMVEMVAATALTGGGAAAGAGIGGAGSGLNETVDQWIAVSTGEKKKMDWTKVGEEALIGAVLGAAGGALEGKWAELLAKEAPSIVGANTPFLQKLATTLIDNETGQVMTAAEVAVKMEPLWGKVVTKLPMSAIKGALHAVALKGIGSGADEKTVAQTIGSDISDDGWQLAIETVLKEAALIK
jgi:hypothetical protein